MSYTKSQKINILITGKPGIGKTTVIKKFIEKFRKSIGGFYTEEIREKEKRVGFRIKSSSGEEGLLSHIGIKSNCNVGKYGVNVNDIDKVGVKAISDALENCEVNFIVIDEIAKMELFSKNFENAVLSALNSSKITVGVIQDKNIDFLNRIRKRNDVKIIRITEENRDKVIEDICKLIECK